MIDYFAILAQPRRPWLDEKALRETFHERARVSHPDTAGQTSKEFASLSEAFRVLSDPKLRLQHLLQLESSAASPDILPKDLEDLFPDMTAVMQKAEDLLKRMRATTNALSRSLFKPELMGIQNEIAQSLATLLERYEQTMAKLRTLDQTWTAVPSPDFSGLSQLYLKISYLSRWMTQLEEKKLELSTS